MGVTFRGKHSYRDIGIETKATKVPVMPPQKLDFVEDIPYMDGSIDFSDAGGRIFYEDKVLEIKLTVVNYDRLKIHTDIERVMAWLAGGYGELILDTMPFTVWYAMPVDISDVSIALQRMGKATVQFRCSPFNSFLFDTSDMPIGTNIPIGSNVPIGWGRAFWEKELTAGYNQFTIVNHGSAPVSPILHFDGTFTTIEIDINGDTLVYLPPDGTQALSQIMIDCKRQVCYRKEGNQYRDITGQFQGDFFELASGDNEVKISLASGENGKVFFEFKPQFYYKESIT